MAVVGAQSDAAGNVFMRAYESLTSWATERSASSLIKAQALTEGLIGAAGKATAVVAATAAAAAWLRCQLVDVCGSSVPSLLPSKARRGSELPLAMFQISRKYRQIPR